MRSPYLLKLVQACDSFDYFKPDADRSRSVVRVAPKGQNDVRLTGFSIRDLGVSYLLIAAGQLIFIPVVILYIANYQKTPRTLVAGVDRVT